MKTLLSKYKFFIFTVFLSLMGTLTATWVSTVLNFPSAVTKICTLAIYLPFGTAILLKLIADIKNIKDLIKDKISCTYYVFAAYFACITAYRFVAKLEIKENLYFAIIFFGSVAIYLLVKKGSIKVSGTDMMHNLCAIAIFFAVYRAAYCLYGYKFFPYQPININLTTGVTGLLLPALLYYLCKNSIKTTEKIVFSLTSIASVCVISTTGSRSIFTLMLFILAAILISVAIKPKKLVSVFSVILCSVLIICTLFVADIGEVRFNLFRQTNLSVFNPSETTTEATTNAEETTEAEITTETEATTETEVTTEAEATTEATTEAESTTENIKNTTTEQSTENKEKNEAQAQINRSDNMRNDLINMGIEQIKKNILFGTGDVLYQYEVNSTYTAIQTSHNFLIEAMICFGLIGLLFIIALFILIFIETGFFKKSNKNLIARVGLALCVIFYLALGFVQPTVFNFLICPVFVLSVSAFRNELTETEQ